tara:strand:- start:7575 stop:7862 length:288 start_codon:yes stop_codon:yes gene_type:complete
VFAEELGRQVYLADVGYILQLQLLVELDFELRLEIICAEVELYLRVLVSGDTFILIDDSVCEARVERVVEYALLVSARPVEVEEEALVRVCDPYD